MPAVALQRVTGASGLGNLGKLGALGNGAKPFPQFPHAVMGQRVRLALSASAVRAQWSTKNLGGRS